MRTSRVPESRCPSCGDLLDAVSSFQHDAPPDPGSICICSECDAILVFNADLTQRKLTARELLELQLSPTWPDVEEHIRAARWIREQRRHKLN